MGSQVRFQASKGFLSDALPPCICWLLWAVKHAARLAAGLCLNGAAGGDLKYYKTLFSNLKFSGNLRDHASFRPQAMFQPSRNAAAERQRGAGFAVRISLLGASGLTERRVRGWHCRAGVRSGTCFSPFEQRAGQLAGLGRGIASARPSVCFRFLFHPAAL